MKKKKLTISYVFLREDFSLYKYSLKNSNVLIKELLFFGLIIVLYFFHNFHTLKNNNKAVLDL